MIEDVYSLTKRKWRCHCRKALAFFDATGLQTKCDVCKQISAITWEDIFAEYALSHPGSVLLAQTTQVLDVR